MYVHMSETGAIYILCIIILYTVSPNPRYSHLAVVYTYTFNNNYELFSVSIARALAMHRQYII